MASHSLALGCPLCASAYDKPNFSYATWQKHLILPLANLPHYPQDFLSL